VPYLKDGMTNLAMSNRAKVIVANRMTISHDVPQRYIILCSCIGISIPLMAKKMTRHEIIMPNSNAQAALSIGKPFSTFLKIRASTYPFAATYMINIEMKKNGFISLCYLFSP
jgi:hypothetical protein